MENKNRAGIYKKILQGDQAYKAFAPYNLPPSPPLEIDNTLQTLLSHADRALGGLAFATNQLPDADYFIFSYLRKEAALSSQIEGTKATFIDAAKAEAGASGDEVTHDYQEILNYIEAINLGLKRMKQDDFPFSLRLIREIHASLLSGVRGQYKSPGEFRTSQNWIGGATILTASYIPPAVEDMNNALNAFEQFMHDKNPMPPLIRIGLIHSQFENIHPFLDGNGRIGRLLITLLLCHYGILPKPALYLSEYFKIFRQEYYDRLDAVHEKGDYEGWLKYFLEGVWVVAEEATNTAIKIGKLKERDLKKISTLSAKSSKSAISLLENLFSSPIVSVNDVVQFTELTFANANNLVQKFVDKKILQVIEDKQRNRIFVYGEYVELFKERESYTRLGI